MTERERFAVLAETGALIKGQANYMHFKRLCSAIVVATVSICSTLFAEHSDYAIAFIEGKDDPDISRMAQFTFGDFEEYVISLYDKRAVFGMMELLESEKHEQYWSSSFRFIGLIAEVDPALESLYEPLVEIVVGLEKNLIWMINQN